MRGGKGGKGRHLPYGEKERGERKKGSSLLFCGAIPFLIAHRCTDIDSRGKEGRRKGGDYLMGLKKGGAGLIDIGLDRFAISFWCARPREEQGEGGRKNLGWKREKGKDEDAVFFCWACYFVRER